MASRERLRSIIHIVVQRALKAVALKSHNYRKGISCKNETACAEARLTYDNIVNALAGTVRRRLTPMPLYRPVAPSSRMIFDSVLITPSYLAPDSRF